MNNESSGICKICGGIWCHEITCPETIMPCKFLHIKPQMVWEIMEHPECCIDYHKIPLTKYVCMYYWDKSFKECKHWQKSDEAIARETKETKENNKNVCS